MGVRGDMRMLERAIKNRWLTEDLKEEAIETIRRGLRCGDSRAEQTAVRSLIAMEAQNQKDEHKVIDVRVVTRNDQIPAIAAELGIDLALVEDAARKAGSGIGGTESQSAASAS